MDEYKYFKIDLSHFPRDGHSAQIEGQLFLSDNIDEPGNTYGWSDNKSSIQIKDMSVIFICLAGSAKIMINMHEREMVRGTVGTVFTGSFFQIQHVSDDFVCAMIAVSQNFMDYSGNVKMGIRFMRNAMNDPFNTLSEEELSDTVDIYRLMKKKLYDKNNNYKIEIAKNFLNILKCNTFQSMENCQEKEEHIKSASRKEEIFMKFIAEVEKHYRTNRNVTFYAEKLFVSPKYLSSVIRRVSHKYATDWIDDYVILEAKSMLRGRKYTVKEICNRLNFANQSFFAKYFKQHTGYTPKEYRNS
ncbi:MAG: helix-turn-helix domain-containing protein [Bacteroides sp.]|nr:helix-turn-helix domain-containing protein [Roseburia sp.]MCM1346812.1 helix-turn-helix domain-containing protein [Bacteroides sp.]MCM1421353.1 helix-turn-helix domain-containing protein [Bacteroides sp.]